MIMTFNQAKVFVVDDDPYVRKSLQRLMRSAGLDVETFAGGKEFLDDFSHEGPACLVLDVKMPGLSGLDLLAKYHIREGMPLCIDLLDLDRWNKRSRITRCLNALQVYGGNAKSLIPRLKDVEKQLMRHREARGLQPQIDLVRETIALIEADGNPPELKSIADL